MVKLVVNVAVSGSLVEANGAIELLTRRSIYGEVRHATQGNIEVVVGISKAIYQISIFLQLSNIDIL